MARTVNLGAASESPPKGDASAPRTRASRARAGSGSSTAAGNGAPTSGAPRTTLRGDDKKLHDSLTNLYTMAGMAVQGRGDVGLSTAGVNIVSHAEATADAWVELAQQNPRIKRALTGFTQGSAAVTMLGLHVSMIAPVLAARGAIRPEYGAMFLSDTAKQHWLTEVAKQQAAAAAAANGATTNGATPSPDK